MMKKILFTMLAGLLSAGMAMGQNAFSVDDVTLPQNSTATLTVQFQLDAADKYTGYQFCLELPEEVEFELAEGTTVACEKGDCHAATHTVTANLSDGLVKVAGLSLNSDPLTATSGVLMTFNVKPAKALTVGQTFTGSIKDIILVPVYGTKQTLADATVTIGEPVELRTILDENDTEAPAPESGADVRVRLSLKAGEWCTLCLPFSMTQEQLEAAFGYNVQLGDFTGADTQFDDADNVLGITANFSSVTTLQANHPYIIKVADDVEEFTADGVDITPNADEACVEYDNGKTGSRRQVLSGFYGCYQAGTSLDEATLYLSGGSFRYATGSETINAYRAYFAFLDELTDKASAATSISIVLEGSTPSVLDASLMSSDGVSSEVYNLSGQRLQAPRKGLNIVGGHKVVVK